MPVLSHQLFAVAALRDTAVGEFAGVFGGGFACRKVNLATFAAPSAAQKPGVGIVMRACSFRHSEKLLTERWLSGKPRGLTPFRKQKSV